MTGLRKWLRPGPADTGLEQYTYLRKDFDLPSGAIDHAVVYTAGAHKYQLWLNGLKLDTGPSFCYPDEQYVQATDVSASVSAGGRNTLGFLHHWYSAGKGRPTSIPGLLAQLSVSYEDGRHFAVGTDGTWKQQTSRMAACCRSATPTQVTSSRSSTPGRARKDGPTRRTTTAPGSPPRCSGR